MFDCVALIDALNSREDAVLVWATVAAVLVLWKVPGISRQLLLVVRSFLARNLLFGIWLPLTAAVIGLLWLGSSLGIWHASSTKETFYWFVGTAFVLAGNATQANSPAKFKKLFARLLTVSILVGFIVNLYVFPLGVELVLVPLVVILAGVQVVAERDSEYAKVERLVGGWLLPIIGVVGVTYAFGSAIADFGGFTMREHLEQFLVPLVMTVAISPFLYYVALWSTYERVFIRISVFVDDPSAARRLKLAILGVCRLSLRRIGAADGRLFSLLREVETRPSVRSLMQTVRAELEQPAT